MKSFGFLIRSCKKAKYVASWFLFLIHISKKYISENCYGVLSSWNGVWVNGIFLPTDGIRECIAIFVVVCSAFNLKHPRNVETLLELMESELGYRKRITKTSVKILMNSSWLISHFCLGLLILYFFVACYVLICIR